MNIVNALHLREQGKRLWLDYSIALRRLKCHNYDEFRGILPSFEGADFNADPPVFACMFCTTPKHENLLALANEDGKIAIQDTNQRSDHNPFEGYQAHHNAIFDIAWAPGEMRLVSASGDHTAVLWDVHESGKLQEVTRFHAHTRSVKTVAFPHEDKMVFATGARDGVIMLWDTRIQRNQLAIRPDNFICSSHSAPGTPGNSSGGRSRRAKSAPSRASSITGLVFQDSHSLISCGAGDGKVKVWDMRKSYSTYRREPQPQYCMSIPNRSGRSGFTCLALDPGKHKLYASCMDNAIYCYNVAAYEEHPVGVFKGHKNCTFYVKACLSPDGNYLLSGSSDEQAYIWNTRNLKEEVNLPIVKLVGHGAEVTSVAWCPVGEVKIVTCSDDARHCLWRIGQEFRGDNHQIELHGWAEDFSDGSANAAPSTPATPATPSFTSWRRWTPCVQRTPDNEIEQPAELCSQCHRLSTPCLRCIATRAPLPVSVPHGSKKRLEVLWEETSSCPECEKEGRPILNQVTNNLDGPGRGARRLFSPTRKRTYGDIGPVDSLEKIPSKKCQIDERRSPKRDCPDECSSSPYEPSPKKLCTPPDDSIVKRTSPRKRCHPSEVLSPQKRFKVNENASCSKDNNEPILLSSIDNEGTTQPSLSDEARACVSPRKAKKMYTVEDQNALPGRSLSPRKLLGTPAKRRISDRRTDSPHKRLPPNDDLQGISKMDDNFSSNPINHSQPRVLCARHSKMGFNSPTLNLPNYVMDGTSPHHKCSPVHHHKESVDWLTRLRRERNSTDKKQDADVGLDQDATLQSSNSVKIPIHTTSGKPASSSAKAPSSRITPAKSSTSRTTPAKNSSSRRTPAKPTATQTTPNSLSQAGRKTPSRRPSNSDATLSSGGSNGPSTSLLRFFRVSEKPIDQQCSLGNNPSKSISSAVS